MIPGGDKDFRDFLRRYNKRFFYEVVFFHPTRWDDTQQKSLNDESFVPLVANSEGQIVSYARIHDKSVELMFPQMQDKAAFVLELFQQQLPAIIPDLFPFSTEFVWLKDEAYRLPNESDLLAEKESLEQEYSEKLARKEIQIKENYQEYRFLHDLLTRTGEELVKAVEYYFNWLGFDDVVNCDEAFPGQNVQAYHNHCP